MSLRVVGSVVHVRLACVALLTSTVCLLLGSVQASARDTTPGLFDRPIRIQIATAYDEATQRKITVTCSYYRYVLVEEAHFEDEEGSNIFVVELDNGKEPPCNDPETSNPKAAGNLDGWLDGVKNDLVVTVNPDTFDDGTGFTIFRAPDHKIILSSYGLVDDKSRLQLKSIKENKAGLLVHYDRIFLGPCSVAGQSEACFDKFVDQTGIDKRYFAKCARMNGLTLADEKDLDVDPTVMAFDVRVFIPDNESADLNKNNDLSAGKDTRQAAARLTTVGRLIKCFPAE